MKENGKRVKLAQILIFGIMTILLICFIFSNSTQSRSESAGRSSAVMDFLKPILDPNGRIDDSAFHHFVRKAAHFTEFAALGFSLMGLSDSFSWKNQKQWLFLMPPLVSLFVAAADEIIQIFSPLRGPGILDVLLDFSGALFGVACMLGVLLLIRRSRERKRT